MCSVAAQTLPYSMSFRLILFVSEGSRVRWQRVKGSLKAFANDSGVREQKTMWDKSGNPPSRRAGSGCDWGRGKGVEGKGKEEGEGQCSRLFYPLCL